MATIPFGEKIELNKYGLSNVTIIMNTEMLNTINKTGYILLKNIIPIMEDDIKYIENQINLSHVFVFNQDWENNDKKRLQTELDEHNLSFITNLNDMVNSINPALHKSNWVILKSQPGCHKQMSHLDYVPTPAFNEVINGDDKSKIPLLVLVSLMENTYLDIWENSIELMNGSYDGEPVKSTKMLLGKGDVLVFRSDVIHAGSEYQHENIRLHCYLDSPFINRENDTTFIVSLDSQELSRLVIE